MDRDSVCRKNKPNGLWVMNPKSVACWQLTIRRLQETCKWSSGWFDARGSEPSGLNEIRLEAR
jgi:hypothetical protein